MQKNINKTGSNSHIWRLRSFAACMLLGLAGSVYMPLAVGQEELPTLGESTSPWKVDVFYENDTRFRGKDNNGNRVGLSKFRNTLQVEADKNLSDGWAFHGILRGTYDGVYQLN
ncbi:MAG: hypothetical protein PHV80_09925, partial [Rugosibacter sp.]|nr:hypothetical protein [Rugosibacter sp.]